MKLLYYEKYLHSEESEWVIFVHGAGGSIHTWKYQVEDFKSQCNVLLVDLRDHGQSKNISESPYPTYSFELISKDIIVLAENLGIQKAHFIGVSLGSMIIGLIDHIRPEMVRSVILAGGLFRMSSRAMLLLAAGQKMSKLIPYTWNYSLFSWLVLPRRNHQKSRKIFVRESRKLTQAEFNRWLDLYKEFSPMVELLFTKPMNSRCLVIMGDQDHVFLKPAIEYASKHETVDLHVINKCGHVCNIEKAEEFNQACLKFIALNS